MTQAGPAEIYAKHADELVRFATVLVGPAAAEDVVAEAVIRAFASPAWVSVAQPRAYLFRATLNQARQVGRADRRPVRRELFTAGSVAGAVDGPGVRIEVLDAMRRLTVRQRAVVFLTYWDDLEAEDVAAALGISTRTVQRELTVARRRLEALLR
ncbi:MAG: RNA polymerase sigma factor [Acidimicrobiales bacterium]